MPPTKTATPAADDLDAILNEAGGEDLDAALEELSSETAVNEKVEVDLSTLDLSGVVEMDLRLLPNGEWFDAEIIKAQGGRSNAGNLQVEFCYQVVSEDEATCGVTVFDQAGVDPRMPKTHWKIKKIAKRVGLLGENGQLLTKDPADFLGRRIKFRNSVDTAYDANGRNKAIDYDYPTEANTAFKASA